jgi:hypothetical protein
MSSPSISVTNWGNAFSLASHPRQSYLVAQYRASSWIISSRTPCESSVTVSFSGQRVSVMRRRRSMSASSGMSTWKGRIAWPGGL